MTTGARIRVDFNNRSGDGLLRASARRADREIHVGDRIIAYQPGESMEHFAVVQSIDESGRVQLDVDWVSYPAESHVKFVETVGDPAGVHDVRSRSDSPFAFLFAATKPYRISDVVSAAAFASPQRVPELVEAHL